MRSIVKWKKEINNIKSALTRKEIFMSEAYDEYSQAETDAMTAGISRVINKNIYDDGPDGITAYSTGGNIVINCGFKTIEEEKDNEKALLLLTGMRAHECGHELFTDFKVFLEFLAAIDKNCKRIREGNEETWKVNPEFRKDLIAMIDDMQKKPIKAKVAKHLLKELYNCFEDSFVNNGIYSLYPGDPALGLHYLLDKMFAKEQKTYDELVEMINAGETNIAIVIMNMLHSEAIGYPIKKDNKTYKGKKKEIDTIIQNTFKKLERQRKELPWEHDPYKRSRMIAEVMTQIYKYLIDINMPQMPMSGQDGKGDNQNQNSGQQSSNQSGSNQTNSQSNSNSSGSEQSENKSGNSDKQSEKQDKNNQSKNDSKSKQNQSDGSNGNQNENQTQNENGSSSSNDGQNNDAPYGDRDLTEEEAQEIAKQILNSTGRTEISQSTQSASISKELDKATAQKNEQNASKGSNEIQQKELNDTQRRNFEKIMNELAKQIAMANAEKEHSGKLQDEANEINSTIINDVPTLGKNINVNVNRPTINNEDKHYAKKILQAIEKDANFLARRLKTILKDREVEEFERRKYSGNKVFVKDATKPGMQIFAKRNEPTGKPNIRICLLIDESGSMRSLYDDNTLKTRAQFAQEKAMMLHQVLNELNVSHCVIGHSASGYMDNYQERLNNYVDFDTIDNNDINRIATMETSGANADGIAISHCAEKLLKYPEKKVIIVISDGLPSVSGYYSNDAVEDTIKAVEKYTKKGVEIIGTTMTPANYKYQQIYKDKLIDCSDSKKFSNTFVKLIQRYVLG